MKRNRSIENRYTLGGATFPFLFKNPPCNVFLLGGAGRGKSNKKTKKQKIDNYKLHPFTCIFARKVIFIAKLPQCFLIPSDSLSCSLDVLGLSVVLCNFLSPLPASYIALVKPLLLSGVVDLFVFSGAYVDAVVGGFESFSIRKEVVSTVAPT